MLDLSKTFNTLDHYNLLEKKIYSSGINEPAHSWVKSFLSLQSQVTIYNSILFTVLKFICVVPQGSISRPFTVYALMTKQTELDLTNFYNMQIPMTALYIEGSKSSWGIVISQQPPPFPNQTFQRQ